MNWSSAADFLAMGGYGAYVWGSFGMAALVMGAEWMSLRARQKALLLTPQDELPVRVEFNPRSAHEA